MDVDRSLQSVYLSERNSYPFISLHHDHISEALERSADNGATLSFSRMNLSDVGARAVEELATMKGEIPEDESIVKRCVYVSIFTMCLTFGISWGLVNCQLGLPWAAITSPPFQLNSHFYQACDTSTSSTTISWCSPMLYVCFLIATFEMFTMA
jgi:hypothetical protein